MEHHPQCIRVPNHDGPCAVPVSDDPQDCECERWRQGATWCPYHRQHKDGKTVDSEDFWDSYGGT